MNWEDWIDQNPEIMGGKPVFKGTRLTVEHVLRELGNGMDEPKLLVGYPRLKPEHIQAAHAYAAALLESEEILFS